MTKVDELKDRIISMIDQGCTRFGWTVGRDWHSLTIEQKATAILEVWDAPVIRTGPVKTNRPQQDVHDFVAGLEPGHPDNRSGKIT